MKILALDLASRAGWVYGDALAVRPASGAWLLRERGQSYHRASGLLGAKVRDFLELGVDQIWIEKFIDPAAQKRTEAILISILLRGAVDGVAECYDVPVHHVPVATARIAFCGKATAHPSRKPGAPAKPSWQIDRERMDTKQMIWRAAVKQGYFDAGQREDHDASDAACVWSYAACKAGRTPPLVLV